jgi:hypothetical protein
MRSEYVFWIRAAPMGLNPAGMVGDKIESLRGASSTAPSSKVASEHCFTWRRRMVVGGLPVVPMLKPSEFEDTSEINVGVDGSAANPDVIARGVSIVDDPIDILRAWVFIGGGRSGFSTNSKSWTGGVRWSVGTDDSSPTLVAE